VSGGRSPLARLCLGALAFVAALPSPVASQEPVYVRRLVLPVVGDVIGYPRGVTADLHTGEVFVCDTRIGRILIFDDEGLFLYQIAGGDVFSAPRDVAIDPEGYLVVVANHDRRRALLELDFDGLFLREVSLSGLPAGSEEPSMTSVALSPSGHRLFVLDAANLYLWICDRGGVVLKSVDLAAGLSERDRRDLILGHVDVYRETVLVAVPSFGQIRTFGHDGSSRGVVGKRGTAPCTIAFPTAAALTDDGELVIADQQRMVILRWDPRTNLCLGEHLGLGSAPGFLYYPMDLALDAEGRMFVSQGFEGRVQMYEGMTPAASPPPSP